MYDIILKKLLSNDIIKEDDVKFVVYGLKQLIVYICFATVQIIFFIISDKLIGGVVFSAAFIMLRCFAGGYHADTKLRCFIMSNFIPVFYVIMSYNEIHFKSEIIILVLSSFILALLSPIDNVNKRLDITERKEYKIKAISVLIVELLLTYICYSSFSSMVYKSFLYSVVLAAVLVLLGSIKNKLRTNTSDIIFTHK